MLLAAYLSAALQASCALAAAVAVPASSTGSPTTLAPRGGDPEPTEVGPETVSGLVTGAGGMLEGLYDKLEKSVVRSWKALLVYDHQGHEPLEVKFPAPVSGMAVYEIRKGGGGGGGDSVGTLRVRVDRIVNEIYRARWLGQGRQLTDAETKDALDGYFGGEKKLENDYSIEATITAEDSVVEEVVKSPEDFEVVESK